MCSQLSMLTACVSITLAVFFIVQCLPTSLADRVNSSSNVSHIADVEVSWSRSSLATNNDMFEEGKEDM